MTSTTRGSRSGSAKRSHLDAVIAEHAPGVRRYLRSRGVGPQEGEDIEQDVFLRLAGYEGLDRIENPRSFMIRIAENILRDRNRRSEARREDQHHPIGEHEHRIASGEPDPAAVAEHRDLLQRTRSAVLTLDEPARTAFMLSRYKQMSYAQIAGHMQISVKTVEKHISAALSRLRQAVGYDAPDASSSIEDMK